MPWHDWSEEDFDWSGLSDAQTWMHTMYRRRTGKSMITKEKYGTIRYEYEFLWIETKEQASIFFEVVYRATKKFPHIAGEIVSSVVYMINEVDHITGWYKGYFEAILWLEHKSKWETSKPLKIKDAK